MTFSPRQWLNSRLNGGGNGRWLVWGVAALVLVFGLYYPVGMVLTHKIDDRLDYQVPGDIEPGASRAVAITAALVQREVQQNGWVANDPFFMPGAMLDNMPNFQLGIIHALGRFGFELVDQLGRTRGSSQTDSDLQNAAGLLQ